MAAGKKEMWRETEAEEKREGAEDESEKGRAREERIEEEEWRRLEDNKEKNGVEGVDEEGNAALHVECGSGRLKAVKVLCECGESLTTLNNAEESAFDVSWSPAVERYIRTFSYPYSASSSFHKGCTKRQRCS